MTLIQCKQVDLSYLDRPVLLQQVNLAVSAGECHRISGETGSGKSSLLMLLAGLHTGPVSGEVFRQSNLKVGLVMQDPNAQFIRQRVGAEVAFALENMGVPSETMPLLVEQSLTKVGLEIELETKVDSLSLGQKYRLMLASQLVYQPDVLLLDEPGAQLDQQGIIELTATLHSLCQSGLAIVIVEHDSLAFQNIISDDWQISSAKLESVVKDLIQVQPVNAAEKSLAATRLDLDTSQFFYPSNHLSKASTFALQSPPFEFGYIGSTPLFRCDDGLTLAAGELALLVGDNGTGKSSFLKAIAGIQMGLSGFPLQVLGHVPQLGRLGSQLGVLLQSPSRQLFESSVLQELEFGLRRFSLPLSYAEETLADIGLADLSKASPHQLSYGQQHLVALASVACLQPKLLLLDDPFAGLDERYRNKVYQLITGLAQQGCSVLIASHKPWQGAFFHHHWQLNQGVLHQSLMASEETYEH